MKSILLVLFCIFSLHAISQNEKSPFVKFGKVSTEDLQKKVYAIDSNANAVILSDIGFTTLEGNNDGWFSFVSKRHTIIHILNKNGYDEASIRVPLYKDGIREEEFSSLKAVTYNLVNGKIVETKLGKSGQFVENIDNNHKVIKFTMPQVKEGSIIEFKYQITSSFISILNPWLFQSLSAPTIWSEFNFSVPEFFRYNMLYRGYHPIAINEQKDRQDKFMVVQQNVGRSSDRININAGVKDYRWVMKDVPELKEESYTNSIRNHISRMEFQLASQHYPLTPKSYRSTWAEVMKRLLSSENFGDNLNTNNNWMSDEITPLLKGLNSDLDKARAIYSYVRDNFKSNGKYGVFTDQVLRKVFKSKSGSIAEINLLLTAMLRYAGLGAKPVILSTTGHGYSFEFLPMIASMNYVIVQFTDGNQSYYLDASKPKMGFNRLPLSCYNGHARIVDPIAAPIYFRADSLKETKQTSFFIINKKNGKWGGSVTNHPGFYESLDIRNEVAKEGKEEYFKKIQKNYGATATVFPMTIDSLNKYELPVTVKYGIEYNFDGEDILYVNPTFSEGYKSNPFAAAERHYPVEMPFAQDELILATIKIPEGYEVDELPKQMIVKLDEAGKSFFEYRISQSGNTISFFNRLKINHALFLPVDYPVLREFFNLVVKKQGEQIVFKKKKL